MKLYRSLPLLLIFLTTCSETPENKDINVVELGTVKPTIENTHKRKALVVGIADYEHADDLNNPENDAEDMADVLRELNFEVSEYINLNSRDFKKAIDDFGENLQTDDIALFFFAGHGIQANGINYLVPTDAQPKSETEVEYDCINSNRILSKMETAKTHLNIIVLDACRNNPFKRNWRGNNSRGLATMAAPRGTIIAFATDPDNVASDGEGRNGLYTSYLKKFIAIPNLSFDTVLDSVGENVSKFTDGCQIPWMSKSYYRSFYIAGKTEPKIIVEPTVNDTTPKQVVEKVDETETKNTVANSGEIIWQDNNLGYFIDQRDSKKYKVVKIGNQVWMAENLAYTGNNGHQRNITDNDEWKNNNKYDGWCYYDNNSSNAAKYGVLYQWEAAKKACPAGWHLPSDEEWTKLENYLIKNGYNWDKTTTGNKEAKSLAATSGWTTSTTKGEVGNDQNSNNRTGFAALSGGYRGANDGAFSGVGYGGYWWSATANGSERAWYRGLWCSSEGLDRYSGRRWCGFSVRCVQGY